MTTVTDVVVACREDYLLAGAKTQRTRLSSAVTSTTATTIVVESAANIVAGTYISVGFEDMYVWSVSTNTLTVERGDNGTTASTHSSGDIVTISPEYSDGRILRSLQSVVEELRNDPGLYRAAHVDFAAPHNGEFVLGPAPDGSTETGFDGVLEVLVATDEPTEPWARVEWDVVQRADDDGSDALVTVRDARYYNTAVRIIRRQTLGSLTATSTNVEGDVGINNTDLLAVGAALRMAEGRAIRRTSLHQQGDSRRANEVAAFSTGNATRGLERRYKNLLNAERIRLKRQYPWRRWK